MIILTVEEETFEKGFYIEALYDKDSLLSDLDDTLFDKAQEVLSAPLKVRYYSVRSSEQSEEDWLVLEELIGLSGVDVGRSYLLESFKGLSPGDYVLEYEWVGEHSWDKTIKIEGFYPVNYGKDLLPVFKICEALRQALDKVTYDLVDTVLKRLQKESAG